MAFEIWGALVALLLWAAWAMLAGWCLGHKPVRKGRLPPGPRPWPMVGNIFQLIGSTLAPHQSLAKLANKHGPIMTLRVGSMTTVVISSSEAAHVMFKNHDYVLAGRKIYESMKGDISNEGSLITAQYGPHWKMLRRLCTAKFFATGPLEAMRGIRAKCVDEMVKDIRETACTGEDVVAVDVGRFFFMMAFNLIGNLIFSKDLLDPKSERGAKFLYHAGKTMEWAGKPNVADFWPILRPFDPQGIRRKTQFHVKQAFDIAGEFLNERMVDVQHSSSIKETTRKDYLDVLLGCRSNGIEGPDNFSPTTINVIVFEMFTAGTDTTTSTLEWAMAELLHNPEMLRKVQVELRNVIRPGENLNEDNLKNLPYLKAVIKETLRLHPPLPFLVPHMAMDSCNMMNYHIPKDTQILVNVWAIGRDPKNWKDPLEFKPERFLEPNMADYKGHHFEYIPFGSGRRICPAVPLVARVLPMALGSILHSFDWCLGEGIKPSDMDLRERMGITLRKYVPLMAIPYPYDEC